MSVRQLSHGAVPGLIRAGQWLFAATFAGSVSAAAESWTVVSPNNQVQVMLRLDSRARNTNCLFYRVEHRSVPVINESPLGLRLRGHDLSQELRFDSVEVKKACEDAYTLVHGKRSACQPKWNQLALHLRNRENMAFDIEVRAYDNGVALRYRLAAGATGPQVVEAEETGFALSEDAKLWCAPSDKPSTYAPAYETYYENEMAVGTPSPTGFGWSFPLLFRSGDSRHWALITEANVTETYCGGRLSSVPRNNVYTLSFPDAAEGNGQGAVNPSSSLPWEMPWRVIVIGDSPAAIVESTLVTDVCPASRVSDTGWVKPGRVAWSWWSDNPSPKDASKQRAFVDLAAEMGWEYVLVDANWTIMEKGNVHEVLDYAKEKGVGVLLWYNSGGPHNVVTEKPRDCFTYQPVRRFELELLKQWGVKGVKIDFFQSDKQDVISLYRAILPAAAEQKIMVNFHGCTLPRGWDRTYPHLMSMEAVRGEECYIFDAKYPESAPVQNTILPFTRNAVGPMDYTPVGFSDNRYPHLTTSAHELALCVLFESGWLHFADGVAAYRNLPPEPKQFLKEVPVAWDETRFVDGYPGRFAILARRKGQTWYLAGVNGENKPHEVSIKASSWLPSGSYNLILISDGQTAREFSSSSRALEAGQTFTAAMAPRGGFVAVLKR